MFLLILTLTHYVCFLPVLGWSMAVVNDPAKRRAFWLCSGLESCGYSNVKATRGRVALHVFLCGTIGVDDK